MPPVHGDRSTYPDSPNSEFWAILDDQFGGSLPEPRGKRFQYAGYQIRQALLQDMGWLTYLSRKYNGVDAVPAAIRCEWHQHNPFTSWIIESNGAPVAAFQFVIQRVD